MREELSGASFRSLTSRITPAHAGRICYYSRKEMLQTGSPPRMREESEVEDALFRRAGITPAHAGRISVVVF